MIDPRRASVKLVALLTLSCLAAALPAGLAAQEAAAKKAPAQSPNGKIVFQSTQGSDDFVNDIFVMDADGKRQTRLTDDPADDILPVWSPQGDRIAFISDRRGAYEVYVMGADGSNQRPLREQSPVTAPAFEWSPDGTRLAYAAGGVAYVVSVDGDAAPVNVSGYKPAESSDSEPHWSPDGGRLVIRNFTSCGGCSDLHVVNSADGGGRVALATGPGFDSAPRWSPDGLLIAYEGDRGGRGVYVTAADGTGAEALVSGAVGAWGGQTWSPVGSRLAFRSATGGLYAVNADGSGLTALSDVQTTSGEIFWSPDGSKVAFHGSNGDGWLDIYVVASDGATRRAANYTKTRRADEFAQSWQKVAVQ